MSWWESVLAAAKALGLGLGAMVAARIEPHLGIILALAGGAFLSVVMRERDTQRSAALSMAIAFGVGWYGSQMAIHFLPEWPPEPMAALAAFFGADLLKAARPLLPEIICGWLKRGK